MKKYNAMGGLAVAWLLQACSATHAVRQMAARELIQRSELRPAQVGLSIYDPVKGKYIYDYQGDKYFVPASNTKLFTLYAGMKYLGDSLEGIQYLDTDTAIYLFPTGDPTLLHPGFRDQRVIAFLRHCHKKLYMIDEGWQEKAWGQGWAWDDYKEDFFAERSAMPVYGNTTRDMIFVSHPMAWVARLLMDTLGKPVFVSQQHPVGEGSIRTLFSRPVDSLFKPMMWHSDNFFAEQTLLMVSHKRLGLMNDAKIIDKLLSGDLTGLPQRPVWVDGSGLSRNDLFSPHDFVVLLDTMRLAFGLDRMERLLPTGGTGTLANYYRADSGFIYAKTGSLSGVAALSGYLLTNKRRLLIFSLLINNYTGSGAIVRKDVERLIEAIRRHL